DVLSRPARQHDNASADLHAAVEILDVLVDQTNAARRYERADGRGLIGSVNAVQRLAEIERACAERIARSARHEPRQIRLTIDHLRRRMPIRPLRHSADPLSTVPGESFAADTDAIAQSFSTTEDEVEIRVRGIDNERAGGLPGRVVNQLLLQIRRELLGQTSFRLIVRRKGRDL